MTVCEKGKTKQQQYFKVATYNFWQFELSVRKIMTVSYF